ncbi:MAG: UDP-N-acetylglucosamine 1-carboxyvinyltransferase [Acidobacteria bacterium]|jgi:UDP-N-acetylglucosamine 1-carboxyvinyltransferase|nr:UDP-N-acetylglucosamine 1-carboxyvinyltransferase [Thermoanaerobaculia bacterium]NLN12532.1 UDP-N-acetylglucosamine 1-carboxyvinyltransferase [Acidobacteriota bacterium]MBP7812570.1 UDP-N-acetylglucosamine 1-carboxyvinyltransferase [Thermoanaerobaculia bacterium]HNU82817.1 UDP-N-acetylglucosamine 1-carboxyvinyltransferase [Thermoanaerobaculia bacterium]HPA95059.1 UDP-N-acetylglucosamine 1-carboxyvinyltransferase [Thermoanaerobaculia bacterium]
MDRFRIVGPSTLRGTVRASGAKNAALPALAATLLTDEPVLLQRVPRVRDITTLRRLLAHLGQGSSEEAGDRLRFAPEGNASPGDAPYELVKTMRASVLVLGPLLARRGHARVSLPGGCAIGVRPIDQHLAGLEALGARVALDHGYVDVAAPRLTGTRFRFATVTVTGTENLLMAAVLARGTTVLENCAREPEVSDLARLLVAMGARIEGIGSSTLVVEGVAGLHGAEHAVIADRIEAGTYLVGAALTGGDVTVADLAPGDLGALLEALAATGSEVGAEEGGVRVRRSGELLPCDLATAPFPGFPTDLQAQFMALMTQAAGDSTIRETIFENRFQHAAELGRMGAEIRLEGAVAHVRGPRPLSGTTVMATDLRASASLVLAALVAEGVTQVERIYHLDRGYERMEEKLRTLGATVERLGDDEKSPGGSAPGGGGIR